MLRKIIALTAFLALTGTVNAQSHYDWRTGNSYNVNRSGNTTTINGMNMRTGGMWNIRQNNNGSYSGRDARGNYFQGNHRTGNYTNFGTGKTCFGKGATRFCN